MRELLFNDRDRRLLEQLPVGGSKSRSRKLQQTFNYHMHPRGIKELVNPKGIRVANLMSNLLDTLEKGKPEERLRALHSLRDEVFFSTDGCSMNKNTARALLSVMKELLREEDDEQRRLELAYDFHSILTGKPAVVRSFLKKYDLLEMPEEWNQLTFDHHVHDAHTKGRKTPSHLIMDAWIKGIRALTVIYYDYIPPAAAKELITASSYMEIELRIGVELKAYHQDKPVSLIWIPRGFTDTEGFLRFLNRTEVARFMKEGRKTSRKREKHIYDALAIFNENTRERFNEDYGVTLPKLSEKKFRGFVGTGQASMLHLSEHIYNQALPLLNDQDLYCRNTLAEASVEEREILEAQIKGIESCSSESISEQYLCEIPSDDTALPLPHGKACSIDELIEVLDSIHPGYRLTLNLTGLQAEDVLELTYLCRGRITALEIYNHKDWAQGLDQEIPRIRSFQHPLNEGNTIALKRAIFSFIKELESTDIDGRNAEQIERLNLILNDLPGLLGYYSSHLLADRWGSDSTGRSSQLYGMGLAVLETLPQKTQKEIRKREGHRILPISLPVKIRYTRTPNRVKKYFTPKGTVPLQDSDTSDGKEWLARRYSTDRKGHNNVIALGWKPQDPASCGEAKIVDRNSLKYKWGYLNTNIKNTLKVLIGFIPAFLTFALTKQWWVLAYLGAPIWFGITGLRNILQSVLGGDSLRRSPFLSWNSYVNWTRVADSLFYTGFSVPLLDFLIKQLLLDRGFGINTSTNVLALYGIMALVNGIYISSHNFFRGLPGGAIAGNFFRSILSIPLAIAFNFLLAGFLSTLGVTGVALIMQKWAAVVSKAASDCVAGIIEGTADRNRNIALRRQDYQRKIKQMYSSFIRMELLLPEDDVLHLLKEPKKLTKTISIENPELLQSSIYDALDLLYFWYYQPHARTVLKRLIKRMSPEERLIYMRFQHVLGRRKVICNLFLEGFLGKNYFKAMAFYLNSSEQYIASMNKRLGC